MFNNIEDKMNMKHQLDKLLSHNKIRSNRRNVLDKCSLTTEFTFEACLANVSVHEHLRKMKHVGCSIAGKLGYCQTISIIKSILNNSVVRADFF